MNEPAESRTLPDSDLGSLSLTHTMKVLSCMTDLHQQMRLSWLFRLFQEASIQHTIDLGIDRSRTLDKGLLWVISRQSVTICRMPVYDEQIRLTTWPGKMLEILFPRYYRLETINNNDGSAGGNADQKSEYPAESGSVAAEGEAFWLLMDQKKRTFAFPRANGIEIPKSPLAPEEQPFPKPLRCPQDIELSSIRTYTPRYSQVDLNGHINNANYYDIIDDLESPAQEIRIPHHIEAEYRLEIRPGTDVQILCGSNPAGTASYYEGYSMASTSLQGNRHTPPMFRILMEF